MPETGARSIEGGCIPAPDGCPSWHHRGTGHLRRSGCRPTRFILMHSPVLSLHCVHNSLFHSTIVSAILQRVVSAEFDTTALLYNGSWRGATLQLNNVPNFRNLSTVLLNF